MIIKNIQTSCTHCGLPVPAGLIQRACEEQFCCGGCAAAWSLIHSSGLDAFYQLVDSEAQTQTLREREEPQQPFAEFDKQSFQARFVEQLDAGRSRVRFSLDGIHCAACVWLIEKLPAIVPGTIEAKVNWSKRRVEIQWQTELVRLSEVATALHHLGYTPYAIRENETSRRRQKENRSQLIQIGIAAAAAGNNMTIAAALYFGMFSYMSIGMESLLRIASCAVGLASYLGPGRVFLKGAVNALRTQTPHMDLPIALGLTAGSVAGLVNTVRGVGEIYFDSLSVLICLLLIGRWIQFRQQNRAADAIELLYRLTPRRARKVVDGNSEDVSADELVAGDLIEVCPGDLIAADGIVSQGNSYLDESILTGESSSTAKSPGDEVSAGTKNLGSPLLVRVKACGEDTRISKIVDLVEQAAHDKPHIVQWANKIGGHFVVVVLLLAVATFASWLFVDSTRAVDRAVALLIVACPCALAMATPLAVAVGLGRLARRKILVKSGDVLQSLSRPGMVWLDKTGTLTEGRMKVVDWFGDQSWVPAVAAIESRFSHPIATAFVEAENNSDFVCRPVNSKAVRRQNPPCGFSPAERKIKDEQVLDGGVSAKIGDDAVVIGNRKLVESRCETIEKEWLDMESTILAEQRSPCWIAVSGDVVGLVGLGDALRPESAMVVEELKSAGWSVGILTGDHAAVANTIGKQLGVEEVFAGVTPEEKLSVIRASLENWETVVMVGDGVNDSASLAAATVGIAVHGGAEASLAAAPVYLGTPGLAPIRELVYASRSTRRTIHVNFVASLAYNILGVGLAMFGLLNPLMAAVLMPFSSLTVISLSTNAARQFQRQAKIS